MSNKEYRSTLKKWLALAITSMLVTALVLGGCDQSASPPKPGKPAKPLVIDRSTIAEKWEKHLWGEYKSDVLSHYNEKEKESEIARFDYYYTGKYKNIAGKPAREKFTFADGRLASATYSVKDVTRQELDLLEMQVSRSLGVQARLEQMSEGSDGKPRGSKKVWQIGAVKISIQKVYDSSYAHLYIENSDVVYRRGKWAK